MSRATITPIQFSLIKQLLSGYSIRRNRSKYSLIAPNGSFARTIQVMSLKGLIRRGFMDESFELAAGLRTKNRTIIHNGKTFVVVG